MNRRIASLIVISLLLPIASAGTATDPEIVDDPNDAQANAGTCTVCPTIGGANVDPKGEIKQAWISQRNATGALVDPLVTPDILRMHIEMGATGDADTTFDITLQSNVTEDSRYFATGNSSFAFTITGTTPDANAPTNTTAAWNGTVLEVDLHLNETGIVGGDLLSGFSVAVTDSEPRNAPGQSRMDTTTDTAPDTGFGRNLTVQRPPQLALLQLELLGGTYTETVNGTLQNGTLTGDLLELTPTEGAINASAEVQVRITNLGNEPDNATVSIRDIANKLPAAGINATLNMTPFELLPEANSTFTLHVDFLDTPRGLYTIQLSAESERDAVAAATLRANVPDEILIPLPGEETPTTPAQPAPTTTTDDTGRTPKPAGLSFLSPVAEGMNLDAAFGDYAELVFLSIVLLLAILIVFLIIMLVRRGGVSIVIEPRTVDVAPGGIAEFQVHVKNSRGEPVDAVASFEGDPGWETSIEFGGTQMREQGIEAGLRLGAKDDASGTRTGTLRVRAPKGAEHKESDRVTLNVAQLDQYGAPKRNRSTQVRVRTVATADNLPIRLVSVDHQPEAPEPGDVVETTARIENDSDEETYHLRVVLNVDGEDLQEQPLAIPPRNARAVVFSWQVPAGSSKIRVRIFQD